MAWCPKCKNEYRDGIDVCPDCDVELVDEQPEEEDEEYYEPKPVVLMSVSDEEIGAKVVRYLRYNGLNSGALIKKEQEGAQDELLVIVSDLEEEGVMDLFSGLVVGEMVDEQRLYELVPDIEDQLEEIENEQASMEFSELRNEASTVYVKKKDKYADLRFSGFSFIGFGFLGVVIILLNVFKVINLFNTYSLIVMGVVFLVFFIIGFATLHRASLVKDSVTVEDEFTGQLENWIKDHLSDDVIDEWYDENREDQENYFDIQAKLCRMMQEEFPNIHPSYIEELAEERYNSYLERSAYESPEDIPEADEPFEDDEDDDVAVEELLSDNPDEEDSDEL